MKLPMRRSMIRPMKQTTVASGVTSINILDSDGNSFNVPLTVLDSDGNSFTISNNVRDSDGNTFKVI